MKDVKVNHAGHRQRVREKISKAGLSVLQNYEIIEYLLFHVIPKKDVSPLARNVIAKFGSLDAALSASKEELMEMDGIGPSTAEFFSALNDITDTYLNGKEPDQEMVRGTRDAVRIAEAHFCENYRGEIALLCLSYDHKFVGCSVQVADRLSPDIVKWAIRVMNSGTFPCVIVVWRQMGRSHRILKSEQEEINRFLTIVHAMKISALDFVIIRGDQLISLCAKEAGKTMDGRSELWSPEGWVSLKPKDP